MSQERQKFPLGSIPPVFCESHQHDLHQSELGQGNLPQSLRTAVCPGFPRNGWFVLSVLNGIEGNVSFGEFVLSWPWVKISSHGSLGYQTPKEFAAAPACRSRPAARRAQRLQVANHASLSWLQHPCILRILS